jgi:hypothetical protein
VDDIARFTEDDLNKAIEEIEVNYDSDSEDNDDKESLKVKVSKTITKIFFIQSVVGLGMLKEMRNSKRRWEVKAK